jgi:NAD(P)-dependent dehydrogenase (short-subunit alcohol dehydrogenase family)
MPDVTGQLAIVTGASSGLGEATAVRLAELGARVALPARSEADLDRVAARIGGAGGAVFALPADLADPAAVVAAAERAISSAGPPRVLVNAAATDAPGPAEELPVADWQRVIAVNLTAPFLRRDKARQLGKCVAGLWPPSSIGRAVPVERGVEADVR